MDAAKRILTVEDAGKQRDFTVTAETKIVGPRGAASKEGLKDERFADFVKSPEYQQWLAERPRR